MVELSESMGVQKVNIERPFPIFVLMSLHTKKKETEQKKKTNPFWVVLHTPISIPEIT